LFGVSGNKRHWRGSATNGNSHAVSARHSGSNTYGPVTNPVTVPKKDEVSGQLALGAVANTGQCHKSTDRVAVAGLGMQMVTESRGAYARLRKRPLLKDNGNMGRT
jgi:hypothetical protein